MPDDEAPAGDPDVAAPKSEPAAEAPNLTQGGYEYELVAESESSDGAVASAPGRNAGAPWWLFGVAVIIAALVTGGIVWLLFGRDDGSSGSNTTAGSLLHAFTSGSEGVETRRFEGQFPPGYPETIPHYKDAPIEASVLQIQGDGLGFIAVQSADRSRDDVAAEMRELYDSDPWQIDVGQDGRDATLYQFTKIDDPDISGLVLLTESTDRSATTIITSVQLATGAGDVDDEPFEARDGRPVPEGFPSEIPVFEGAIVIEAAFQNDAQANSFAVSSIVQADIDDLVEFYRDGLEEAGLTVEDGDPTTSALEDAQVLSFTDEAGELVGEVAIGRFPLDDGYVQIDVQVGDQR